MKRNLFFKFILLFAIFNFVLFAENQAQSLVTITIDSTSIANAGCTLGNGGYASGLEYNWTQGAVGFGGKAIANANTNNYRGTIQMQADNGVIYNTTPLQGRLVSVVINQRGATPRQSELYGGNTERVVAAGNADYAIATSASLIGNASTTGWTETALATTNVSYFCIKRKSNALYAESIVITYEQTTTPNLNITAPINGAIVYEENVDIQYNTNMIIGNNDYKIKYTVNTNSPVITTDSEINVTLEEGENTITLELVNNDETSLSPAVTDAITITKASIVATPPEITIINPANGATINEATVNIDYSITGTVSEMATIRLSVNNVYQQTYSLSETITATLEEGENEITIELLDEEGNSYSPAVISTIIINYEIIIPYVTETMIYRLVTNNAELEDGGKYLFIGAKEEEYYAMSYQRFSASNTETNRFAYPIELYANALIETKAAETIADSVAYEFTLNQTEHGYTIKDNVNNKYLRFPGSNNYLTLTNDLKEWTININANNEAEIIYYENIERAMKFNANATLFSCYTSAQTPIYLYKAIENPLIIITSPENNTEITEAFSLTFNTINFTLSNPTGDGYARLYINNVLQQENINTNSIEISLADINFGENTIKIELVDNDGNSFDPEVSDQITITYIEPYIPTPEITITSPSENESISTINAMVTFTTNNTSEGYSVTYILDENTEILVEGDTIYLPSPLTDGNHSVTLNLYDENDNLVDNDIVNFIALAPLLPTNKVYQLVTSAEEIIDGGKYIVVGIEEEMYLAMGVQQNNNRWAVPVNTPEDNYIVACAAVEVVANDTVNPYEIELQAIDNAFAIYDIVNAKYLVTRTSGSSGNYLKLSETPLTWNINVNENNEIIAECNDEIDQSFLRFNDNNFFNNFSNHPLFSAYAENSNMSNPYFYKLIEEPIIIINNPENNEIFTTTNNVNVNLTVYNFELNNEGSVKYILDENTAEYTNETTILLENLSIGEHNLTIELVDLEHNSLTNPVSKSISFNILPSIEITNIEVSEDNVTIEFATVNANLGNDSYVKLTINDEEFATDITESPIELTISESGNYIAVVELVDMNFNSFNPAITDTDNFTITITSVNNTMFANFNIFPNPTTNYIIVNCEENIEKLTIYNSLGQVVKEIENINNGNSIDISFLKSGNYTVKVENNGASNTRQLIVK